MNKTKRGKTFNKKVKKWLVIIGIVIFLIVAVIGLYFATRTTYSDVKCGDGFCDYREQVTCPQDCAWEVGYGCGDGFCDTGKGENITNCQMDCSVKNDPPHYCGDGVCQEAIGEDKHECPIDCGLPLPVCGNGICEVFHFSPELPPYSSDTIDEFIVCPEDCGGEGKPTPTTLNNEELIYSLNQQQRPLVGGISIELPRGDHYALCTIGAIVKKNGVHYILTAGHCVTEGEDGFPDPSDIGLKIRQGEQIIGEVYKTDFTGGVDVALISIQSGISSEQETFLGNSVLEFGTVSKGLSVFKIGRTTGLTYGTITDFVGYTGSDGKEWQGFEVTGDNGVFSTFGDSGSAIITVSKPHKIVGILSAGDGSNMPDDIKNLLGI